MFNLKAENNYHLKEIFSITSAASGQFLHFLVSFFKRFKTFN